VPVTCQRSKARALPANQKDCIHRCAV
jgi:hypothetical protein